MHYWKRCISFLMAMTMVLSLLPVAAFADDTEEAESEIVEMLPEETETPEEPEEAPEEPEEALEEEPVEEDGEEAMDAAITGSCGYDMTWSLDGGVLTITGTGDMDDYSSRTGAPWKQYRTEITSIVVKDGVEGLGRNAFNGCKNVTSVSLPETLVDLSDSVFEGCTALKRITLPDSLTNIDNYVFKDCTGLTTIVIPSAVTSIGAAPFYGCSNLTSISVGSQSQNYKSTDGVLYNKAGTELMMYPTGRSGSFAIPKTVTRIGSSAFEGCANLSGITIPTSVTEIADSAFEDCSRLSDVTIPSSVKTISYNAFSSCTSMKTVTFQGSAPDIWANAFYACELTAFYNGKDSSWKKVVGEDFGGKILWVDSSNADANITEPAPCGPKATWVLNRKGVLTVSGSGDMDNFTVGRPWDSYWDSIREVVIESGITSVGDYAFAGYTITKAALPDSLTRIGESAFNSCGYLANITLPAKLKTIDSCAFQDCVGITSMTIPASVTAIGDGAFTGCMGLRSFSVVSGSTAFSVSGGMLLSKDGTRLVCCPSGKTGSCEVPDGVKTVSASAFGNCSGLTAVTLPQGLTTIGEEAFRESGIASAKIPDSVTTIGARAFANCGSLKAMTFEGKAPKFGVNMFLNDTLTVTYPADSSWNTVAGKNYGGTVTWVSNAAPTTYTIRYDANGGTGAPAAQTKQKGVALTLSSQAPTRKGCTFLGWAASPTAETAQYAPGSKYTRDADATLYAVWKATEYKITYVLNGGTNAESNPAAYTVLSGRITLADPTRKDYRFLGWYLDADFRTKITAIASGTTGDLTLYASWVSSRCTLTYDANGGTGAPKNQTCSYGETIRLSTDIPKQSGYLFQGWALTPDAQVPRYMPGGDIQLTGDVTLYAVWEEFYYSVAYDANGGESAPAAQKKLPGEKLTITTEVPVRYGYTFQGWATTQKSTSVKYKPGAVYSADKDLLLYAVWKASVYSVKFDANGGKGAPSAMKKTHDKAITLPKKVPTLQGYTCTGWADSPKAAEPQYLAGKPYTAEGDTTLYAVWTPTVYTITYVLKDGVPLRENPVEYTMESGELVLHDAAKEGFTFGGWFTDSGFKKPITSIAAGSTGNLKIYAKWTEHKYSVHFEGNGAESGKMTDVKDKKFSVKFALKANAFKRTGYDFDSWNTAPDGSGLTYSNKQSVSGLSPKDGSVVTLYAQWKLKTFTVTFKANKGQGGPETQTKYWGRDLVLSSQVPTREGYTFQGWGTSSSAKKPAWQPGDVYTAEKNLTLYAIWAKK